MTQEEERLFADKIESESRILCKEITNDDTICKDCMYKIKAVYCCKKYMWKPNSVVAGTGCPEYKKEESKEKPQATLLCFEDLLRKAGLDPSKVKLIRHSLRDAGFKACYEAGRAFEYTCHQRKDFSKGYEYWVTFIGDKGTLARLCACYKVLGSQPDTPDITPDGLPEIEKQHFKGEDAYYELEPLDIFREYENKLVIDWGKSTRMWHQKGTSTKPIVAIHAKEKKAFPGFEKLILTYDELKDIVDNVLSDDTWRVTLSSVNAVYLIVDTVSGKQYVGSAYNSDGLWGRWTEYAETRHGGNKLMKALLEEYPERYHRFRFSVLRVLPKTTPADEVIAFENLFKIKLQTYDPFGLNDN